MDEKYELFEKDYNALQEKFELPTLEEINELFEIRDALQVGHLHPTFPLRYVRRHIVGILYNWINYLHNFIMPNPQSAILIRESEYFSEEQKNEVINLIKEIMFINRYSAKLDLINSDEENVKFIIKYVNEWPKFRETILKFAKVNVDSWEKDMPSDKGSYFG